MINKNIDGKTFKRQYKKPIFSILVLIYSAGLAAGCAYALKNSQNMEFIVGVVEIEKLEQMANTAVLGRCAKFMLRDLAFATAMLIFKYSGVLKGLCLTVPFVLRVQNSAVYISGRGRGIGLFELLAVFLLKDAAISFLMLTYCYIILNDIMSDRQNIKKDFKKLIVYYAGIIAVYLINCGILVFL